MFGEARRDADLIVFNLQESVHHGFSSQDDVGAILPLVLYRFVARRGLYSEHTLHLYCREKPRMYIFCGSMWGRV